VHVGNRIQYCVSQAESTDALLTDLSAGLRALQASDPNVVETTLLIHPNVLLDFLEYNDFLDVAEAEVSALGLRGQIQLASFHPDYRFAGSAVDDIENYTNRSPYPMLHLLRETSIARVIAAYPDPSKIYEKNMETLRRLGHEGWRRLFLCRIRE
jgi:hypothetical protein